MENSWVYAALVSVVAVAFISKLTKHPARKLPPGPKPWPVIGNLHLLGSIPHQSLHELSQKYGEIMLLKFGKCPVVVASSPEMAKQFLRVHDAVFASRPELASGYYLNYNSSDLFFCPYGPYWRQVRKICVAEVLSAKKLDSSEPIRAEETCRFLSGLRGLSGTPVLLREHLSRHTLSNIFRMLSKEKNSAEKMDELREMIDEWLRLTGATNIGDWIPWLGFLDLQGYVKKMKALRKKIDRFYDSMIDDHLARKAAEDSEPRDFVDLLLQIAEDPNLEVKLTRDCVKALIQDLIIGGNDTTATTVEWAVHELLRQPRILKKAKEELDRVIGRNKWVEESDFSELPYIEAIIMETFRLHPLATILAPHYAMEDCKVAGYDVSKGTMILVNTWSIGRDPNSWDAPTEEFLPERFLGKEVDMMGSNFALLPFGSGRRGCPGSSLGLKMVRTTLANLVHGFEMKLGEGMRPGDISMEEEYGVSTHPKKPISIIMEPILPAHLY